MLFAVCRRWCGRVPVATAFALAILAAASAHLAGQTPFVPGTNVNMVRGTSFVDGDPYLQRQNEPSIAISTRNPCHLLAGSNDYRTVDFPDPTPLPNEGSATQTPSAPTPRDAWVSYFTSSDCGTTWRSSLLPGHPFDTSPAGLASVNHGFTAAADPVVRAGTNGLFFYAGLVFDRADQSRSQIFVARFIDNNNKERGETIAYVDAAAVDVGDPETFVDKPWLAVDQPRGPGAPLCDINGQQFPAGRVYAAWARFEGGGARIMLSRSIDCGRTWQAQALSDTAVTNQGASIAIAPHDGTVYVVWRQFAREGSPASIQMAVSRDGGATFTRRAVASPINPFDQPKLENRRFRTNSLPTVAADHLGRVYVAWAERGYALASGRTDPLTGDARIVVTVSSNFGQTFAARYPIDDTATGAGGLPRLGHQVMPALTFSAGKLQAVYYDFSDDISGTFNPFVDEAETPPVDPNNPNIRRRHTVDVRAAHADPAAQPRFVPIVVTPNGTSPRLSQYRTIVDPDGTVRQVQFNPPNLPLFVAGTTPFIGDYIDVAGLSFVPSQGTWRHNNSTTSGPRVDGPFPALPVYHAVWADHRDVKPPVDGDWTNYKAPGDPFWKLPGSECVPSHAGMRNANIYTARIGNGLYAGSPGNTKPLGFRRDAATGAVIVDPTTGRPVHMQRSFVVFAQNSLRVPKTYLFRILNQPGTAPGDRASFLRAPQPPFSDADLARAPYIWLVAQVAPLSTISRTVFVTAANERAFVRVDVLEVAPPAPTAPRIGSDARLAPVPLAGGLRATVLLNPDPTNPAILDPDHVSTEVPVLAEETHDPEIFDPVVTTIGAVTQPFVEIRNPDEANPDEANPDEANIDEETPDEANPDEANPDEANPDEANPDEANPDEANLDLTNTALGDGDLANAHVVDVQWKVANRGNTTTAFRFSPTFSGERTNRHFQLLVTKRYYVPAVDGQTCDLGVRRTNQVLVNVSGFEPRNPDEANPDEANPDEANPDEANPDEANPDEANPDEANATFFLAPGETATATLRIYDTSTAAAPPPAVLATFEQAASAVIQSLAPNTGQALPPRDVAGADLVAVNPLVSPSNVAPGGAAQLTWTLANRGTEATGPGAFRARILFSNDRTISEDDREITVVTLTGPVPADDPATPGVNEGEIPQTTPITLPDDIEGPRHVLVLIDALNEVPEADESNNASAVQLLTINALAFLAQPSRVTQGFVIAPAVRVAALDPSGQPASPTAVPLVRLAIASGPAGATLGGGLTAQNVGGVATFTDVTASLPGVYTLVATAVGFEGPAFAAPAVSAPFVVEPDDPPVAVADSYSVEAGGILDMRPDYAIWVTANDVDEIRTGPGLPPQGRQLQATVVQGTTFGRLEFSANGGFLYVPNETFDGVDFFTYRLHDGVAQGNVTTVRIAVGTGEGNAPPVTGPLSITVAEDSVNTPIDVLAAAADADGDDLSLVEANAGHGTVTVAGNRLLYTPDADYHGADTIHYMITDGAAGALGTVSVTVTPVNDNPVAVDDGLFVVPVNGAVTSFTVLDNDHDGPDDDETLTIVRVGRALHGVVDFTPTLVRYTPNRGYAGPDSFSYQISDGRGGFASALVRISVGAPNGTPDAVDDHLELDEDGDVSINVLANDGDPDDDPLTIVSFGAGQHGSVEHNTTVPGVLRYVPHPNFNGADSFVYTVGDGRGGQDTATVHVTVAAVNDDPSLLAPLPDVFVESGAPPQTIDLTAYFDDVDVATNADELTFSVTGQSNPDIASANVEGSMLTLSFGATGTASIGVRATDLAGAFVGDTFLVTVGTTNQPPVANPDSARTTTGTPVTINVLANDVDPDREVEGARVVAAVPLNPPDQVSTNTLITALASGPGTPYVYAAGSNGVSVISTAGGTVVELIDAPAFVRGGNRSAVDPASGLVIFSTGASALFAIDGRPAEPTFNDVVFGLTIGGRRINGLTIDSERGRLYVLSETFADMSESAVTTAQSRIVVVDVNRASDTFGQVTRVVALPTQSAATAALNPLTRDLIVGTSGANSGVYLLDADTFELRAVTGVLPVYELAVDGETSRAYGLSSGGRVLAVDLVTETLVANSVFTVPGLASAGSPQTLRHLALDPDTGRVWVRSNGAAGAAGVVVVLQPNGDPTYWTVVAQVPAGRDSGADDLVIDPVTRRAITGGGLDFEVRFIDTDTNQLEGVAHMLQPAADLELSAPGGTRRVYVDGLETVTPISLSPFLQDPPVLLGGLPGRPAVLSAPGTAFVPVTDGNTRVLHLSPGGFGGEVSGLPHNAGRMIFAAADPANQLAYVVNQDATVQGTAWRPGYLAVINALGVTLATYPLPNGLPNNVVVNETTGRVHVPIASSLNAAGGVAVFDPATGLISQVNTSALFTSAMGSNIAVVGSLGKVYVQAATVDPNGSPLAVYTEAGLSATRVAAGFGLTNINAIVANDARRRVYVVYTPTGEPTRILVLDATDDSVVTTLELGSANQQVTNQPIVTVDVNQDRIYVTDYQNDAVHVLDAETHALVRTLHVGDGPVSVAVNSTANRIYVGSLLDSRLTFVDGGTLLVRGGLDLPHAPAFLAVDPAANRIYASSGRAALPSGPGVMVIADDSTFFTRPLTIAEVSEAVGGTVTINDDQTLTFTPLPTAPAGVFNYRVSDGQDVSAFAQVSIAITPPMTFAPAVLPSGAVGTPYLVTFDPANGHGAVRWSATGTLPPGVALESGGVLRGTPTASGAFTFTVTALDESNPPQEATQTYTVQIGPPVVPNVQLPNALVGQAYSYTLTAGGTIGETAWSLVGGTVPEGLTLFPSGLIDGAPTTAGFYSFTVRVDDAETQFATGTVSIFVDGPPALAQAAIPAILHSAYTGMPYVATRPPVTLELIDGTLPPGFAIAPGGASITGTAQTTERAELVLRATDARGRSDQAPVFFDTVVVDQLTGGGGVGATTQPLGAGRRLAQTLTAGTDGYLTGVRSIQTFCVAPAAPPGAAFLVELRPVTGADVAVPDESGPPLATATGLLNSTSATFSQRTFFRAGERFALVFSAPDGCEFRQVANTPTFYQLGHALESVAGGPWTRIAGAEDLSVQTLIQPPSLHYFTTNLTAGGSATLMPARNEVLIATTNRVAQIVTTAGVARRTVGDMIASRTDHTATLLDDGSVLIVGGRDSTNGTHPAAAERLVGDSFQAAASLARGRELHTATRLPDGRVVIAGGSDNAATIATVEIYTPDGGAGTFAAGAPLLGPRRGHTATLLTCPAGNPGCAWGGKILIAGGVWFSPATSAELYDPIAGTSTPTSPMHVSRGWQLASAKLGDGRVLFVGGSNSPIGAEVYDPASNSFSPIAGTAAFALERHTVTSLPDGDAIVAGGRDQDQWELDFRLGIHRFDAATNTFSGAGTMKSYRADHTATLLPDGRLMLATGLTPNGGVSARSLEFVSTDPAAAVGITTTLLPQGQRNVPYPTTPIQAAGGTPPYTFTLVSGGLPPGLTFTNGVIAGTPTSGSTYFFVVQVTDSSPAPLTATMPFQLRVDGIAITTTSLPGGQLGVPYDAQLTASGTGPWRWMITSGVLPAGMAFSADGALSGTPTAAASNTMRFRVEDATGQFTFRYLTLDISAPLTITTASLRHAIASEFYNVSLAASGGNGRTWTIESGSLPHGLLFSSGGSLSGTPWETGVFPLSIRVTDNFGRTDVRPFTFEVGAYDYQRFPSVTIPPVSMGPTAQVLTVGANGTLFGIRSTVTCSPGGTFSVAIQGVTADGLPNGQVLLGPGDVPLELTNLTPLPAFEVYALPARRHVITGSRLAVVFEGASCEVWSSDESGGGLAYRFNGSTWEELQSGGTLRIGTVIAPDTDFAFASWIAEGGEATHLFCPAGGCAYPEQVLLTGSTRALQTYDPATHRMSVTSNALDRFWHNHTATRLNNGLVLLAGGYQRFPQEAQSTVSAAAAIYNPASRTMTPAAPLNVARESHQAVLLEDGRVLVVGGLGPPDAGNVRPGVAEAEIYDPSTGVWTIVGSLNDTRWEHTLTRLDCPPSQPGCAWGGKVLALGGWTDTWPLALGELFDPDTGVFTTIEGESDRTRAEHAAVLLPNGLVWLSGGRASGFAGILATTDLYNPANGPVGTLSRGPDLSAPRSGHTATLLADGTVAVAGGLLHDDGRPTASIERYFPDGNRIEGAGALGVVRRDHMAVRLLDGRVAFAGGYTSWSRLGVASLERWDPADLFIIQTTALPGAEVADAYSEGLDISGGTPPYVVQVGSGQLPDGLVLFQDVEGVWRIDGVPAAPGTFAFALVATDAAGRTTAQQLTIVVRNSLGVGGLGAAPPAVAGTPVDVQLEASGGNGTSWTWEVEPGFGAVPPGMTLAADGRFSGTPAAAGHFSWVVRVTDNGSPQQSVRQRLRWNVAAVDRQQTFSDPEFGVAHVSAANNLRIAQTLVAGRTGLLRSVRLRFYCDSGHLTVSVYDASTAPPFLPAMQMEVEGYSGDTSAPADWREVVFRSPPFLRAGEPYAVVVNSFNGSCSVSLGPGAAYQGGSTYSSTWSAPDNWTPYGTSGDFAFATLVEPLALGAFGQATVDGRQSAGEWSNASIVNMDVRAGDGQRVPATVFFQNDADNLYLSIAYDRDRFEPYTATTLFVDGNANGDTYEAGEDVLFFNSAPTGFNWFGDQHQSHQDCAPFTCWRVDELTGGTTDGRSRESYAGTTFTAEMQHPIAGGDAFDLEAVLGQAIGFRFDHLIWEPNDPQFAQFPEWDESPAPWTLAAADDTCVLRQPGLVAWWPGNALTGTRDVHGEDQPGVLQGDATAGAAAGRHGEAFAFAGAGSLVVNDTPVLSPHVATNGELTVEAWVNLTALPAASATVIGKAGALGTEYALDVLANGQVRFTIGYQDGTHASATGGTVVPGTWHHVAGTFRNGRSARVYVDGVLVDEDVSLVGSPVDTTSPLYVGARGQGGFNLNGRVDEPAVYGRELTPEQVASVFRHCKSLDPSAVRFTLQVITTGHGRVDSTGGEISCGADCITRTIANGTITLNPVPHAFGGVAFLGFSGACTGLAPCTLTLTRDMTVRAAFTTNYQPWANGQVVATTEDVPTTITLTGGDPEGQPITFSIQTPPAHGTLSALSGAQVTYTPDPGFVGTDVFYVDAFDGYFRSGPAAIFVTVGPGDNARLVRAYNTGAGNSEFPAAVLATADGGYLLGRNVRFISDDDIVVTKLTASGARAWETRLQAVGAQGIYELTQTTDGGYALVGGTGDHPYILFIAKLSSTGTLEWQKVMGAAAGDDFLSGSIADDGAGNLYVSSTVEYQVNGDMDIWVAKLTAAGALTWQKWLGVVGGDEAETDLAIVGGNPTIVGHSTQGLVNGLLFQLDPNGVVLTTRRLATTTGIIQPRSVVAVPGGGYIVVGMVSRGPWAGRFNADHSLVWSRDIGSVGSQTRIDNAVMRADGLLVMSGSINTNVLSAPRWIAGIDLTGAIALQLRYDPAVSFRNVVAAAQDGGFAIVGTRAGAFGDETVLIKTDVTGLAGCDYGTPTSFTPATPAMTITTLTGAAPNAAATVVSTTLTTGATVTSNIVRICPVP